MDSICLPLNAVQPGDGCYPVLSGMRIADPSLPVFLEKSPVEVLQDIPGKYVRVLAHEIRNPLTNINLAVELVASQLNDKKLLAQLDIIMRASLRINNLLNELFTYQIQNETNRGLHSIPVLLDEVLAMAGDRISLRHIKITRAYDLTRGLAVFNRLKIKIALTNIIINAIDSMNGHGGELKLSAAVKGDKYVIDIEDNGCGISKENLQVIFKPFYSNKPGGLGIGLATTCEILQANRVGLTVESELAKGTHFILLFNRNDEQVMVKAR